MDKRSVQQPKVQQFESTGSGSAGSSRDIW